MKLAVTYWFKLFLMLVSVIVTSFTLNQYAKTIQQVLKVKYNWQFEFLMVVGMLLFQFIFLHKKSRLIQFNYYYKMLLVSLLGSLLLWPLLICNFYRAQTDFTNIIYFFIVVIIMFFVHKKIVKQLQLPFYISYTWVLYRFLILIFII
jgi:hypothetical protein